MTDFQLGLRDSLCGINAAPQVGQVPWPEESVLSEVIPFGNVARDSSDGSESVAAGE